MSSSSDFPLDRAVVGNEINKLIQSRGLESLTSKLIRKHFEEKYSCSLKEHRDDLDKLTREQIDKISSHSKEEVSDSDKEHDKDSPGPSSNDANATTQAQLRPVKRAASPVKAKESSDESEDEDMVSVKAIRFVVRFLHFPIATSGIKHQTASG